jgi:NAD(P)-dependent dehydrogenase (short-subunit alcohol dehydrogenase family)
MQDFEGKVAVVTGAASGIGRALAERFAREGMKVVLADVEEPALETAVRELTQAEHEVIGVPVRGLDGEELGSVADIYRVGENEVYVVRGGARGEFDLPAVRDFIRIFAPRRGEIVVDVDALELGPVRPPRSQRPPRPRRGGSPPGGPVATEAIGTAPLPGGAEPDLGG